MDNLRPVSTYKPSLTHDGPGVFAGKGQRSFFDYRDLGIGDATNGDFNVYLVRAKDGKKIATGWHYHTCDLQIVYCLRGWEDLALEDGRIVRITPGSCLNIPPGFGHNEVNYSDDLEVMVIIKPVGHGTVQIPRPANAPEGT